MQNANTWNSVQFGPKSVKRRPISLSYSDAETPAHEALHGSQQNPKTLLLLVPFWTPMIPPMGICQIKAYLQDRGHTVRTADLNTHGDLRRFYQQYFDQLSLNVPDDKKGNFYSIGHDVLRNHMMAHIHRDDEDGYLRLVRIVVSKTYFVELSDAEIRRLGGIISTYFECLQSKVIELIELEEPAVLGLSVFRDTLPSSMFVFRMVKERFPTIHNIMGGSIFSEQLVVGTPDYEFFLEKTKDYIDKIIIGQGEVLLHQLLLNDLLTEERVLMDKNRAGSRLELSSVSTADYSDIDLSNYLYLGAAASTGCLYRCSFCNAMKFFGPFKARDARQTVDEMEQLWKTYKIPFFFLADHMVNPIANEIAEEIAARGLDIHWTAYLRVDNETCIPETTARWRKGGMYCARLGIESGSQRVLSYMGKSISPEQCKLSLMALSEAGIKTTAYFVVGHPGETEEDFQCTLDFLTETRSYIWEAECDYFNYNYSGQSHSDKWSHLRCLVYPEDAREMLVCQKWSLDCPPYRDEIFSRIGRFSTHCRKLGIPNTYSYRDIHLADARWRKLHKNAVPALLEKRWTTSPPFCVYER